MLIAVLALWEKQQHWFYVSNQLPFFAAFPKSGLTGAVPVVWIILFCLSVFSAFTFTCFEKI